MLMPADQMKAAKLQVVHNFWSNVYDFTPKSTNWHYLEPGTTVEALLGPFPDAVKTALGKYGADGPLIDTWGHRAWPSPDYLFVIFPFKKEDAAMQFLNQAKHEVCSRGLFKGVAMCGWALVIVRTAWCSMGQLCS